MDSIERIYVRRAGLARAQRSFTGAKLTAPVRFADRSEPEILAAVAHFAFGRVWLG